MENVNAEDFKIKIVERKKREHFQIQIDKETDGLNTLFASS